MQIYEVLYKDTQDSNQYIKPEKVFQVLLMSSLQAVAKDVVENDDTKGLEVDGHDFWVKPVHTRSKGGYTYAEGWISHRLSFRPDDQVHYSIQKSGGEIRDIDVNITRGGLGYLVGELADIVGGELPFAEKVGKLIDGSWEGACSAIIFTIATEL